MTEQKELLERISNLAFDIQHTDTLQVAFDKAQAIQNLVEGQQSFKVGEYYAFGISDKQEIFMVMSVSEDRMSVQSYRVNLDLFTEFSSYTTGNSIAVTDSKLATADEIALFKRAEHFHSKGRKLNEFKHSDVVWIDEEYQVVFDMENRLYLYNICGEVIGEQDTVSLIMTAEELEAAAQEVKG